MSSEEYDLRKSQKDVGQLYPVLLDKKGRVIDGLHRLNVDSTWRTQTLEHIDDEEKFLKARIISNIHRRTVPASEIRAWINDLAEIALQKGIKPGRISFWIADETGYAVDTVQRYLELKYKDIEKSKSRLGKTQPREKPISSIKVAEEKLGRETVQQLKADLREEVKEELRRDPDFIVETVEKAPMLLPLLPKPIVTREGYYKPVLTRQQAEELRNVVEETDQKLEAMRRDPEVQEQQRWVKMWMSMTNVLSVLDNLFCPICNESAKANLVFKCHPENGMDTVNVLVKQKLAR